jgi:hypothetical protein
MLHPPLSRSAPTCGLPKEFLPIYGQRSNLLHSNRRALCKGEANCHSDGQAAIGALEAFATDLQTSNRNALACAPALVVQTAPHIPHDPRENSHPPDLLFVRWKARPIGRENTLAHRESGVNTRIVTAREVTTARGSREEAAVGDRIGYPMTAQGSDYASIIELGPGRTLLPWLTRVLSRRVPIGRGEDGDFHADVRTAWSGPHVGQPPGRHPAATRGGGQVRPRARPSCSLRRRRGRGQMALDYHESGFDALTFTGRPRSSVGCSSS